MKEILILIILSFAFLSCGDKFIRDNPREQYRQCLKQNPEDLSKCDHLREAYQQRFEDNRDIYQRGSGDEGFY